MKRLDLNSARHAGTPSSPPLSPLPPPPPPPYSSLSPPPPRFEAGAVGDGGDESGGFPYDAAPPPFHSPPRPSAPYSLAPPPPPPPPRSGGDTVAPVQLREIMTSSVVTAVVGDQRPRGGAPDARSQRRLGGDRRARRVSGRDGHRPRSRDPSAGRRLRPGRRRSRRTTPAAGLRRARDGARGGGGADGPALPCAGCRSWRRGSWPGS